MLTPARLDGSVEVVEVVHRRKPRSFFSRRPFFRPSSMALKTVRRLIIRNSAISSFERVHHWWSGLLESLAMLSITQYAGIESSRRLRTWWMTVV
jgi:hypothetical protein